MVHEFCINHSWILNICNSLSNLSNIRKTLLLDFKLNPLLNFIRHRFEINKYEFLNN